MADIQDSQNEDHEQEAAQADQEEAGQLAHGRDRVRQPLGRRQEEAVIVPLVAETRASCLYEKIGRCATTNVLLVWFILHF